MLLAGDVGTIPMRYVYLEDIYGEYDLPYTVPTDDYYCNLEGDWDLDGDGIFGEPPSLCDLGEDEVDWTPEPELYLGRLPADDAENMTMMVEKILSYEGHPAKGSWRNRVILAAAVFNDEIDCRSILDRQADMYLGDYECIKLYESAPLSDIQVEDTLTSENFIETFNRGALIVYCRGHGVQTALAQVDTTTYEWGNYSTVEEVYDLKNGGKLPLVMHCACLTGCINYPHGDCVGEALMKAPNGGAIIFLGSTREGFAEADFIFDYLFGPADLRPGIAFRKAKIDGLKYVMEHESLDEWHCRAFPIKGIMLGDPELQILTPSTEESATTEAGTFPSKTTSATGYMGVREEGGGAFWGATVLALLIIGTAALALTLSRRRKPHPPTKRAALGRRYCMNCGQMLGVGARFCPKCGSKVEE